MAEKAGPSSVVRHRTIADAQSLIHLFSPPVPPVRIDPTLALPDRWALWTEDSVHRAKNLAQLAAALVQVRPHAADSAYLDAMARNAAALADAYAELARASEGEDLVPCAPLMTRIVQGLIALFGEGPRPVRLHCAIAEIELSCEQRRAFALIASELVVNALKYAFPERGGTISVSLQTLSEHIELVVEDDGIGLGPAAKPGSGSRILDELSVMLGAPVERRAATGGGLHVSLRLLLGPAKPGSGAAPGGTDAHSHASPCHET